MSIGVLEWIDLASGETKLLCQDGGSPVWSMTPLEKIYFVRLPVGVTSTPVNQSTMSIWQCDPDGQNLARLTEGYVPSFLKDGSVLVSVKKRDPAIKVVKGFRVDQNSQWVESGFELEVKELSAQLSPDGKLVSESGKSFTIRHLASKTALHSFDPSSRSLGTVSCAWSPDSRYVAYCSSSLPTPGVWVLDVQTGENRLLADTAASKVRWSHDGRFIEADERGKNQIVILDLRPLHLENGLGNLTQQTVW